jgi:hypothetical protein
VARAVGPFLESKNVKEGLGQIVSLCDCIYTLHYSPENRADYITKSVVGNPSYSGRGDRRISIPGQPRQS